MIEPELVGLGFRAPPRKRPISFAGLKKRKRYGKRDPAKARAYKQAQMEKWRAMGIIR